MRNFTKRRQKITEQASFDIDGGNILYFVINQSQTYLLICGKINTTIDNGGDLLYEIFGPLLKIKFSVT